MRIRAALAVATVLWAVPAAAGSTKTFPNAGITHIHRWDWKVAGQLQDYHVLLAEIGGTSLRYGVSREADRNHPVSWFGSAYKALVAVNGSMFNFTEHKPCGAAQSEGTFWKGAWSGGCNAAIGFGAGKAAIADNGGTLTGPWPAALSFATDGLSGTPWLIKNGVSTAPFTAPGSITTRNARTAVGITATGKTLILVTVDSGRPNAAGMTGADLVTVFTEFGAHQALYLDGTASTTLWVGKEGGLQNVPSNAGKEQLVSSALMILPPLPPPVVMEAGVDARVDAITADSTLVEDTSVPEVGSSGPEDPTGDAGETADGTVTEGVPSGLGGSTAEDASCGYSSAHSRAGTITRAASLMMLMLMLLGALFRRAGRGRA